jgi:hypothetical protein
LQKDQLHFAVVEEFFSVWSILAFWFKERGLMPVYVQVMNLLVGMKGCIVNLNTFISL